MYLTVMPRVGIAPEKQESKQPMQDGAKTEIAESLLGDVEGKDCIIYDDIIDTAGTITQAAQMLKDHGANRIYIAAAHGLFNGPALERLEKAPIEEVVVTNSELKPDLDKIKQVDIAPKIVGTMLDISG